MIGAIFFRVGLLTGGMAVGEIGLSSFAAGQPIWLLQLALSAVMLVAGSAGFMVPLLGQHEREERSDG